MKKKTPLNSRRDFLKAAGAATIALSTIPLDALADMPDSKLKIGIIGSGRVGGTLGGVWAKAGHPVMFSSLDLEADKKLAASIGQNASAGSTVEAAKFGDVLLISVPYKALPTVGKELRSEEHTSELQSH